MSSYVVTLPPHCPLTTYHSHLQKSICFLFYFQWGLKKLQHASLVAQIVKNLPPMWEIQVWLPGYEEPPEKEMTTQLVAWKIPWTGEPERLQWTNTGLITSSLLWFKNLSRSLFQSQAWAARMGKKWCWRAIFILFNSLYYSVQKWYTSSILTKTYLVYSEKRDLGKVLTHICYIFVLHMKTLLCNSDLQVNKS